MNNTRKPVMFFLFCCGVMPALAQGDFSRFIKSQEEIDRNTRQENRVVKKDVFANKEEDTPASLRLPEEEHCFVINDVIIENDFLNQRKLTALASQAAGRCMGSVGIQRFATWIQDAVINAGYVTTRVNIPDQDLSAGVLRLTLAAGRIENIIITGQAVRKWVLPFQEEGVLNLRDIEQGLELLQRVPSLDVKINIEPAQKENYSNVVVNIERKKNGNLRTWVNSWGDKSTGKTLAGVAGYLYNPAKLNDIFYLSVTGDLSRTDGSYKSFSTYYSLPWGYWDYEIFYSNSHSRQGLNIEKYKFDYKGKSRYLSLKGTRTFYRDQNKKLSASAELIKRDVSYKLDDIALTLQKRDMLNTRFALQYKQNLPGAALEGVLSWQRFVPWFGAHQTPDMASGDVSKHSHIFNLDINYIQLFTLKSLSGYYDVRLFGQYSPGALTLQDQLTLGSRWSVRGFEYSGGINGNKGFYVKNNVNVMTGISNLEWYVGVDYGQLWGDASPAGTYSDTKLMGAATGVKGSIKGLSYDVSVSTPIFYPDALTVDNVTASFNFSWQL